MTLFLLSKLIMIGLLVVRHLHIDRLMIVIISEVNVNLLHGNY